MKTEVDLFLRQTAKCFI